MKTTEISRFKETLRNAESSAKRERARRKTPKKLPFRRCQRSALTEEFGGASAHRGMAPASDAKIGAEVGSKLVFIIWFLSVEVLDFPLRKGFLASTFQVDRCGLVECLLPNSDRIL